MNKLKYKLYMNYSNTLVVHPIIRNLNIRNQHDDDFFFLLNSNNDLLDLITAERLFQISVLKINS